VKLKKVKFGLQGNFIWIYNTE